MPLLEDEVAAVFDLPNGVEPRKVHLLALPRGNFGPRMSVQ